MVEGGGTKERKSQIHQKNIIRSDQFALKSHESSELTHQ